MRSNQKRWGRNILVGLWLMMLFSCTQVVWASEIQMKATAGINGQIKYNRDIPVNIKIENGTSDFKGRIQITLSNSSIEYSEAVNIAAGASQSYMIPIKNNDYSSATVRLLDSNEKEILKKVIYINRNMMDSDQLVIGVLSDQFSNLNYLRAIDVRLDISYITQTIKLEADNIDEKVQNLDILDILVINDYNTSQLLPEQLQAIKKWINQGGTLVVGTGVNGSKTLSGLTDKVIPVTTKGTKEQEVQCLEDYITLDLAKLDIKSSEAQGDNQITNYTELYNAFSMGSGKVIVATYDLGLEPMVSYSHNKDLWRSILSKELKGTVQEDRHYSYWGCEALTRILSTYLPHYKVLVAILIIYIMVMGVVTYLILKKKQKKEYIWIVAPILSIGTTLILYGMSIGSRLEPFVVNQLEVVRVDKHQNANKVNHFGVLNIQGRPLTVGETNDISFKYMRDLDDDYYVDDDINPTKRIEYTGDKLQYQAKECSVYDKDIFVTETIQVEAPAYQASFEIDGYNYHVTLANNTEQEIQQLLVLIDQNVWDLGALPSGEKVDRVLRTGDSKDLYDYIYNSRRGEEDTDVSRILEIMDDVYFERNYSGPTYLAITENKEPVLPILQGQYFSDFNYSVVLGELEMAISKDGEVIYPYGYFDPYIISENGNGNLDDYSPVMTIGGDLEVILDYPIAADCEINWIDIGMNSQSMSNYYHTNLKGQVYLYNYQTEEYEEIQIPTTSKGYLIEQAQLANYFSENTIRLKVVGQNEDCALVPSIKVGGTSNATN